MAGSLKKEFGDSVTCLLLYSSLPFLHQSVKILTRRAWERQIAHSWDHLEFLYPFLLHSKSWVSGWSS